MSDDEIDRTLRAIANRKLKLTMDSSAKLNQLFELTGQLTPKEKAELTSRLIKEQSALSVVLGNQSLSSEITFQINLMSVDSTDPILVALAERIRVSPAQATQVDAPTNEST